MRLLCHRQLRIRDLLSKNPKQKLELKDHPEGGVFVKDLTVMIVKGVTDLQQVMEAPCPQLMQGTFV